MKAPSVLRSFQVLFQASRGFWLVNLANFGDGIAYFGILALMTLFMQNRVGFTTEWATISISFFTGAVTIFMALGGGAISDRLGVRRALTLCFSILVVGRVLYVLAPEFPTPGLVGTAAWISLAIMAVGEGVIQPALYSGVKEYTDERTKTLGYAFLYSIMNLGIVAGEFISPKIREGWASRVEGTSVAQNPIAGITGSFWFFILLTVLLLALNVLFFTRKVEERDRQRLEAPATQDTERLTWAQKFRRLPIMDARFQFFIFILLPVRTLFAHQWLTMPDYVVRAFPPEVGAKWEWINGLNPLVIVIFVPLIAAFTLRRKVVDMMIVGTSISALSTFMLIGEPNTALLLTYIVVFSIGEAVWSSRFLEYVADIAPTARVGLYMGIANIPWFLAKALTGLYAGSAIERFIPAEGPRSPGTLWLIYGFVAVITPLGLLLARKWLLTGVRNEGVAGITH